MTNPFAHLQPAQPDKPLQALSVSNVHLLSQITPSVHGFLSPDYTRYMDYCTDTSYDSLEYTFRVFDTLSDTFLMKTGKYRDINTRMPRQLSRNGSKLLINNEIYDCVSGQIIHKIPTGTNFICDWDFNFCYLMEAGRTFSCYSLAQKKQDKFFNVGTIEGYFGPISPDGSLIVVGLKNKSDGAIIIDTKERKILHRMPTADFLEEKIVLSDVSYFSYYRSRFSLDNLSLFTEGNKISIWAMNDGKCVYRDPNSHSAVSNLDSTLLFLSGNDGIIHIYDVKQWKEIHQIHLDYIKYLGKDVSLNNLYRSTYLDINSDGTKLLIQYAGRREIWGVY